MSVGYTELDPSSHIMVVTNTDKSGVVLDRAIYTGTLDELRETANLRGESGTPGDIPLRNMDDAPKTTGEIRTNTRWILPHLAAIHHFFDGVHNGSTVFRLFE